MSITPVAKAIYLCDGHIAASGQKTDLIGLFNLIRPRSYPHRHESIIVFAQLAQGLGKVPFYVQVSDAGDSETIYKSAMHQLIFPSRTKVVQMAFTMRDCVFPSPGIYLAELFCNDQWVADTSFELAPATGTSSNGHQS